MRFERTIAGKRVWFECAERFHGPAEGLLDTLDELDRTGPSLHDGSTVQFGWTVLTLKAEAGGLRVYEPNYLGDPFHEYGERLDLSLQVILDQVRILEMEKITGVDARFDQHVRVWPKALDAPSIFLHRLEPQEGSDSGWVIADLVELEGSGPQTAVEKIRVYELLRLRAAAMQVLALPPGYAAIAEGDRVVSIFRD